jgi:hypothetical protein
MNQHESNDRTDRSMSRHMNRTNLQTLLFTGAAFGTELVTLGAAAEPKLPPYFGS